MSRRQRQPIEQCDLFADEPTWPEGFAYREDVIPAEDEESMQCCGESGDNRLGYQICLPARPRPRRQLPGSAMADQLGNFLCSLQLCILSWSGDNAHKLLALCRSYEQRGGGTA